MKRKILVGLASGLLMLGWNNAANAMSVAVTYTGDNVIDSLRLVDGGVESVLSLGANYNNWVQSDSIVLTDLLAGHDYSLVWQVSNADLATPTNTSGGGDPAAFLAEFTGDVAGGALYSSDGAQWEYSLNGSDWFAVAAYGANGGANIWTNVNGGKVEGISELAQWIWSGGDNASLYLKANFQTTPVPEATTMLLFGVGLAGLASVIRRQRA